jgi:uncharacterized protein involved in exopolysaccharide biosynthesis
MMSTQPGSATTVQSESYYWQANTANGLADTTAQKSIANQSFALGWGLLLKQEKHWILGVFLVGLVLTAVYFSLLYHGSYKTEADVFIKDVPRSAVVADYSTNSLVKTESGYSNPLFNYQQVLKSELLASKLYPMVKDKFPADLKQLKIKDETSFNRVLSNKVITSKILPSSDVLKIVIKWPDPQHAEIMANEVIQAFKKTNIDLQRNVTHTQKGHLDVQLETLSNELTAVRKAIRSFKLNNSAVEIGSEGEGLVKVRVDLEHQLELLEGQIRFNRSRVGQLKHMLSVSSAKSAVQASSVGEDPYLVRTQALLSDLEEQRAKLKAKFTDEYPDVQAMTNQIEQIKKDMATRRQESLGGATSKRGLYDKTSTTLAYDLAKAQAELVSLQSQKSAIASGVGNLRAKTLLLPNKELGLKELEKKESSLLFAYEALRGKQLEARIKDEAVIDNLVVLSAPSEGTLDITGLVLDLAGWLLLFAGLAVASAWVKDSITNRWNSKEALESLTQLPVLTCIPWRTALMPAAQERAALRAQNEWFKLAQHLKQVVAQNDAKIIGLFSTVNYRHQSSLISSLAYAFTKNGQIPLVLEPLQLSGEALATGNEAVSPESLLSLGTLEALIDQVSGVIRQNPTQADLLISQAVVQWKQQLATAATHGKPFTGLSLAVTNQPEKIMPLFASEALTRILTALAKEVDCILVNAPALDSEDATVMSVALAVDGALVYVSPKSKRPLLKRMLVDFEKLNCPVLGLLSRC